MANAREPVNGHTMSPRQIGWGFSASGKKFKELHEEFWLTGLDSFVMVIFDVGESAEIYYR